MDESDMEGERDLAGEGTGNVRSGCGHQRREWVLKQSTIQTRNKRMIKSLVQAGTDAKQSKTKVGRTEQHLQSPAESRAQLANRLPESHTLVEGAQATRRVGTDEKNSPVSTGTLREAIAAALCAPHDVDGSSSHESDDAKDDDETTQFEQHRGRKYRPPIQDGVASIAGLNGAKNDENNAEEEVPRCRR
ncbi:hypothetical protein BDZ89DRAFT_1043389 [Hymenopellis radicata]|nr:hypothetical protein BDZ89DRAFT_1043389 [Hymenopellis radicata]